MNTQLSTLLPPGSNKIRDLQKGQTFTFAGYPACRYYLVGVSESLADQRNQWRCYQFAIEVFMKTSSTTKATYENTLEDAIEAVMNAIDADYTLGGNADNAVMEVGSVTEGEFPWGIGAVLKLTLKAYTLQFF